MKDKGISEFLSTVLYYVEEKKYPLPIAFKRTKNLKKVKRINYDILYDLSRELILSYHLFKSKRRSSKVNEYLSGIKGVKFPDWMEKKLNEYIDVKSLESSLIVKHEWIRINTLKGDPDKVVKSLETQGVTIEQDKSLPYMYKVISGNPKKTPEFKNYQIVYQDKASALVVEALHPEMGDIIIDLSSAPGVKLSHIMAITENKAKVYAADLSIKRLKKELAFLKRMGVNVNNVFFVLQDSSRSSLLKADKILLDAPCSSSGMISNEPSILLHLSEDKVNYFSNLQWEILQEMLKNMEAEYAIYAVCSFFPEEGEKHTDKLLSLLERPQIEGEDGYSGYKSFRYVVRLFPNLNMTEGFFISKIKLYKY